MSGTADHSPGELRAWLWTGAQFDPIGGLPVSDRGFRYGMSVFESFPLRDGKAVFLEQHLIRLREACAMTGFEAALPALDHCADFLEQASDGFARLYVTAGDGPITGACDNCRVLILIESREPTPARVYHRGYDLGMHPGSHIPLFPGLKTGNYWSNVHAFREGVAALHNETLLFTPAGHLISASMANVFVVHQGRIHTPDLRTGARNGVIREWVMQRLATEETLLTRAEAEAADEIFLTSSWLGIMPAASIEGHPLPARSVCTDLLGQYRNDPDVH